MDYIGVLKPESNDSLTIPIFRVRDLYINWKYYFGHVSLSFIAVTCFQCIPKGQ